MQENYRPEFSALRSILFFFAGHPRVLNGPLFPTSCRSEGMRERRYSLKYMRKYPRLTMSDSETKLTLSDICSISSMATEYGSPANLHACIINRIMGETYLKHEFSPGAIVEISRSSSIIRSLLLSLQNMYFNKASLLATAALISEVAAIPTLQSRATAGRFTSTLTVVNVCSLSLGSRLRCVLCPSACC